MISRTIVFMGDVERSEARKLLLGIADHLLKGGVGGHVTVVGIAEHDPNRRFLEHCTPAHLARLQGFLGAPAFRQIACDIGEADDVAFAISHRAQDDVGPKPRSVLADPPAFSFDAKRCCGSTPVCIGPALFNIFGRIKDREMSTENLFGGARRPGSN